MMVAFFVQHKSFVRVLSLILIFALCISGLTVLTPAADALAITASVTAIIITFLALCGITFASADLAKQAANEFIQQEVQTDSGFWADIQSAADRVDNGGDDPEDPFEPGQLAINAMTGASVAKLFNKIKSWFGNNANDGNVSVELDSERILDFQGVKVYRDEDCRNLKLSSGLETNLKGFTNCPYSGSDIVRLRSPITGDLKTYSVQITNVGGMYKGLMLCNGVSMYDSFNDSMSVLPLDGWELLEQRYGFFFDSDAIHMYQVGKVLIKSTGRIIYLRSKAGSGMVAVPFRTRVYYTDFLNQSKPFTDNVAYQNKTVYSINSIYNALSSQIKSGNSVVIDISDTITEIEDTTTENLTINQEQLLVQTDILTALEELVASQPDDPYEGVPKPSPMPTIGNIWDYVSDLLENALIWMKLWVSGFNELPQSLQDTLWAILVVVIVIGILGVIL